MAEAVVSIVLETLRDLLVEKARFLSGVTDQVDQVSTELKRMQCFLKDADSRLQNKDESVHNWLREIRQLAYKVEDIVETFAVKVASNKERGIRKVLTRFSCVFCEGKSLQNLGLEIAKVRTDIGNLTTSLQRYDIKAIGAREECSNENERWERQTYAHESEEHFVGMEEDFKKLVSLVLDDDKRHGLISVWGMGGLGKTTLARKVYKHEDVQRCFERFAWACVTQQGNIRSILQDILMQFLPDKIGEVKCMGDTVLVHHLNQVQKENKCLVVLDDIWKVDDWRRLVAAFPVGEGDSKILLTTRKRMIAEIGFAYAPKCLTENESWELLKRIVVSRKNFADFKIVRKIEDVGIEMVRKCGGLSLAISVLGGVLKDKDSLADWQMVNKYISTYLSMAEDDEAGGVVARVLSLSYNDLPYHLKPCFLYLGIFPEDENIDAEQLYFLWMAEGMVLSQHRRSEETLIEVAQRYLDELGSRSMVQVNVHKNSVYRRFLSCRVHDMMRDLCLEKGKEEEFIKVIDFGGVKQPILDSSSSSNIPSRLVIHNNNDEEIGATKASTGGQENCQQLRSILCLNAKSKPWGKKMIWPQGLINLDNCKSLRALKFEGYDFQENKLPVELRKLIHLRLLNLNNCKLDELPSSIADLPFLQTLDIQVNNEIKVPNVLWKMKQLRHLCLLSDGRSTGKGKLRFHGLSELETLWGFNSKTDEIADITNLTNLRSLFGKVSDNNSLHVIINHINMKELKLQEIALVIDGCDLVSSEEGSAIFRKVLMCGNLHHLGLMVKMSKFPKYEPLFLQNLVGLSLQDNKIEEDPMKTLEKLPQLQFLILGTDAYVGQDMICHEWGFPQLRVLHLFQLPNLEHWRVDKGAMHKTSSLMIWGCQKLDMVPDGLKFVVSLKNVIIFAMPGKFCNRIKDIDGQQGEDFDKIQHVPSISIDHPFPLRLEAGFRSLAEALVVGLQTTRFPLILKKRCYCRERKEGMHTKGRIREGERNR